MDLTEALDILARRGLQPWEALHLRSWSARDQEMVAVLRFLIHRVGSHPEVRLVAVIGGASSGKSTVFNNLIGGRHASRVTLTSHTTKGVLLAVPAALERVAADWLDHQRLLLPGLGRARADPDDGTPGAPDTLTVIPVGEPRLGHVLLFDTPDYTTESSRREGDLTHNLLPWFDGLLVLVNQGRWDDERTFASLRDDVNRLKIPRMVLFNFNAGAEPTENDLRELEERARRMDAPHQIIEFRHGRGFRKFPDDLLRPAVDWLTQSRPESDTTDRRRRLRRLIAESAGDVLNEDAQRLARLEELKALLEQALDGELPGVDQVIRDVILTPEQRKLLSPQWRSIGRSLDWLRGKTRAVADKARLFGPRAERTGPRSAAGASTENGERAASADAVDRGCAFFASEVRRLADHLRYAAQTSRFWREAGTPNQPVSADLASDESAICDDAGRLTQVCADALARFEQRIAAEAASMRVNLTGVGVGAVIGSLLGAVLALPTGGLSVPAGALVGLAIAAGASGVSARALVRLYHAVRGTPESRALWDAVREYQRGIRRHAELAAARILVVARLRTLDADPALRRALEALGRAGEETLESLTQPGTGAKRG